MNKNAIKKNKNIKNGRLVISVFALRLCVNSVTLIPLNDSSTMVVLSLVFLTRLLCLRTRILFTLCVTAVTSVCVAAQSLPSLPQPTANNAVALVELDGNPVLMSFMGLGSSKDYKAVHNKAYQLRVGDSAWQAIPDVPSSLPLKGRLASVAVGIGSYAYLFGGYTVASDHSEISSPDNFRYDPMSQQYVKIAPMPVAVDDAVALVYQDRYIYLISGWHNDGNVNLTQVYDTQHDSWSQASVFPGRAVFGHAGGIVSDTMIICDGVAVKYFPNKRRGFEAEPACFKGVIDKDNPNRIAWTTLPHPNGVARYRMAASGVDTMSSVVFIGGSINPYNFNGIGYDGNPSKASKEIWMYNLAEKRWFRSTSLVASMDHRGLLNVGDTLIRVGGMQDPQRVTDQLFSDNITEIFK